MKVCNSKIIVYFFTIIVFISGCDQPTIIQNKGNQDYTESLNYSISKSNHLIIKPGYYTLTAPIILHSNLVVEGEGEVILIKKGAYSHVFINKNAQEDLFPQWDTSITIKNIIIDEVGSGGQKDSIQLPTNGVLSFNKVYELKLSDIKIKNGDSILFGIHLQSVKNAEISNYFYDGDKDGVHINGGCQNITIDGFDISSFDDAFGIMTDDYPRVQHNTADIRNIEIKNGVSRQRIPQTGFFLRFMTGSWKQWHKGNKYNIGHIVNLDNRQYKKLNGGDIISEEPPIHIQNDSTYSDGITWRYMGIGRNTTSNIYNVRLANIRLEDGRKIVRTINADSNNYGEYPGTENTSIVDSIYIEGYRLNLTRGKIGLWKTIPPTNYLHLIILLLTIILLIRIVIIYFRLKRKGNFNRGPSLTKATEGARRK